MRTWCLRLCSKSSGSKPSIEILSHGMAGGLLPDVEKPSEPRSAPFNFKKNPPAKKKKHGEAETGRGRTRRPAGGAGRRSRYPARGAYERISSHHARGAWESVRIVGEIGSRRLISPVSSSHPANPPTPASTQPAAPNKWRGCRCGGSHCRLGVRGRLR